jgi:hypothetical protein
VSATKGSRHIVDPTHPDLEIIGLEWIRGRVDTGQSCAEQNPPRLPLIRLNGSGQGAIGLAITQNAV